MDELQALEAILRLGWPGIVMIQCVILWRDNQALRDKLISVLENKGKDELPETPKLSHTGQD